jgi:hypothetical protein
MFLLCVLVYIVDTVDAIMNTTVSDHKFVVTVTEGLVDQMGASWGLKTTGGFHGSGWE